MRVTVKKGRHVTHGALGKDGKPSEKSYEDGQSFDCSDDEGKALMAAGAVEAAAAAPSEEKPKK